MERLRQLGIILGVLLIAETIEKIFKLALPGTILGMIILTILLLTRVIKLESVEKGAETLIGLLAFLFIPILVEARDSIKLLKGSMIPILIIVVVATFVVLIVTALTVQFLNRRQDDKERKKNEFK